MQTAQYTLPPPKHYPFQIFQSVSRFISFSMDRQISYNGPLVTSFPVLKSQFNTSPSPYSPLPRSFPSSLTSTFGTMNHPLPPKPPISKFFFHAYIPRVPCVRDLGTLPGNPMTRRIDRGECLPVNSGPRFSSGHQPSTIEMNGTPPTAESAALPSGEDSFQELKSDCKTSSVDINIVDLPLPDILSFGARDNDDALRHESSVCPRFVDDGICHVATYPATSEVPEADPSSSEDPVNANHDDGHVDPILSEAKGCVPDVTQLKNGTFSHQSVEKQLPRPGTRHSTGCSRLDPAGRKRPASAALETEIETASGPRTRARVRAEARAEVSRSLPTSRKAHPYSTAEDDLLGRLVTRGLSWEQIKNEFGQVFAGRNVRSLQVRWSRTLKFAARPGRLSKRRRANDGAGRQCF